MVIELLTRLLDRRYPTGAKRRRSLLQMVSGALDRSSAPSPHYGGEKQGLSQGRFLRGRVSGGGAGRVGPRHRCGRLSRRRGGSHARLVCDAYKLGWRRFICFGHRGQRFLGCGLGPDTAGVRIDAYGATGDYLGSGLDGAETPRARERPGPDRPDPEGGQARGARRRGPDLHVRRKGRGGLCDGQCRGPAPHQCRGPAEGRHQRHRPRLPRRIIYGRRPLSRRRLRDPERPLL